MGGGKILTLGPHFCQKYPSKRAPFHKNFEKNVKSAIFEAGKPLKMGPNLQKNSKKTPSNKPFLEREKSLDMGKGFRPQGAHPCQKII